MLNRRHLLASVPLAAFALQYKSKLHGQETSAATSEADQDDLQRYPIASPPVIQQQCETGFNVVFKTNGLSTGWIEWGLSPNELNQRVIAHHHGRKQASDLALNIRVSHAALPSDAKIYFRIAAQPLKIEGRQVQIGTTSFSETREVRAWNAAPKSYEIVMVHDTHENADTIARLADRIAGLDPNLLIWNGDTCNDFHPERDVAEIVLSPGRTDGPDNGGWASSRPLIFIPGNHDVRGVLAYELQSCLIGTCAGIKHSDAGLPYCQMRRIGPLAFVTLDTGEDKPDAHPTFQGTAAYEPYREQQAHWLKNVTEHPDFATAPYRLVFCHIPLRGLAGQPDGTVMEDFARYSGFGAKLWMPTLVASRVQAILSGHMHQHRIDAATESLPMQIVGGGPRPEIATLTRIRIDGNAVQILVEDIDGKVLNTVDLKPLA